MTIVTLMKEKIELGLAYSFRGLVHYCHDEKHGTRQAHMVLSHAGTGHANSEIVYCPCQRYSDTRLQSRKIKLWFQACYTSYTQNSRDFT